MQLKPSFHFMDWPLRAKMAVLLVVALVLPLAIAIFVGVHQARVRLLADTVALLAARGDQLAGDLDTFNRGYQRSADHVAHLPAVVEFFQADAGTRDRLKVNVRTYLEVWPASDPNIRGIALLDLSGRVKIATEAQLVGVDLSYRRFVQAASRGVPAISDVYLAESEVGYAPTIAFIDPVFGPGRRLVGTVAMWIRPTALWRIAKASNELAGPGSYAVLVDRQGIRIAHTYRDEVIFHPTGPLSPATINELVAERRFGKQTRQLLDEIKLYPELFKRAVAQAPDRSAFRSFSRVNRTWNYGVARRFETVPWTVFYLIPEQSLNAEIARTTREETVCAAIVIVLPLLTWFPFATLILKPIDVLSKAIKLFAGDDSSARVPVGHGDELGELGVSFNSMADHLMAAREAALAASNAKSEFLSSMSHEIRTPMTAILGMAELLAESELDDEQHRHVEVLCDNGRTLLDLINAILDLAKIESGRLTLEHVPFDLREVAEKSAQTFAFAAHSKGLELVVSIAPEVPPAVLGDPLRLRQVLINLIGNAIKFTEKGEVLVSVDRDSAADEPLRLKISVCDTGIGIVKEKIPALFAIFEQADSSTARRYGGSGLGLAIVKRLVGLMHSEVTVESELGKGSTFSFIAAFEPQPGASVAPTWPDLAHVPVLIVEDHHTTRAVLRRMLTARGANITEAASNAAGLTAIRECAGSPPRIVLLDDRVCGADRNELANLIAAVSQCGASLIGMIHSDNLTADISRLRALKLDTYLVKPIDTSELAKVLRHLMAGDLDEGKRRNVAVDGNQAPIVGRPLKILFADDSKDNRMLIRAFLKKTPYQLDEVENGRQAIDGFIAGHYDLVLMDIQMPEVDGCEATRAIRDWERDHHCGHTPIIALTASVFTEAVRLTRMAGCDAHVAKPISKATLLRTIFDAVRPPSDTAVSAQAE